MKLLILADIVGRIGRTAAALVLPELIKEHEPTLVVANFENLAHGCGMTPKTVQEMLDLGVDIGTGGNHTWDKELYKEIFADKEMEKHITRPLNETKHVPGEGMKLIEKDGYKFAVINVMGNVYFEDGKYDLSLPAVEKALERVPDNTIVLMDVHAEATAEKAVLSRFFDGKIAVVWGSHTHVPTADERLMPKGSAFITDIGLTGAHNEAIGLSYENVLPGAYGERWLSLDPPLNGPAEVNAIVVTFENGQQLPSQIERVRRIIKIE